MAERRMFAKTIIDSDSFLDMPMSTQCLYFHLSMRADDDGFLNNPRKIQRMVGATDDDLKLLIAKNFILTFDTGVIVIKHWKIHNYIRNDRYKPTVYQEEKQMLTVKDNGSYTLEDTDGIPVGIPSGYQMETQVRLGKDRIELGKDSIGKDNTGKPAKHKYGDYQHVLLTDAEYDKLTTDYGIDTRDAAIKFLDEYIEEKGYKSKSHNLAIRRWVIDAVSRDRKRKPEPAGGIDWSQV